jgi:hypothetical protein
MQRRRPEPLRILSAGCLYFALVFATGFVLGSLRILWVVPRLGERTAELLEMPVMLLAIVVAARWVVRRAAVPPTPLHRLGMGGVALALMLIAEFGVVLRLRGLSVAGYLADRDPVSGTVYYAMLLVFGAIPLLLARR